MESLHKTIENHDRKKPIYTTMHQAYRNGFAEGFVKGFAQGYAMGLEKHYDEGLILGYRISIRKLAQESDVTLTPQSLRRLDACDDIEQLKSWMNYVGTTEDETAEF